MTHFGIGVCADAASLMRVRATMLGMPRTVTILFPDGSTEYWLTNDPMLTVGDKFKRNGQAWIVAAVDEVETGRSLTIKLRRDDGSHSEV